MDDVAFRHELEEALAGEHGPCEIVSVERRGEGWSWETFMVEARCEGAVRAFAVKREPTGGINPPYDVVRECAVLRAVREDLRLPAPRVIALRPPNGTRRGFYVMEKVSGSVPMAWNVRDTLPDPAVRERVGRELARVMARLHTADPATLSLSVLPLPADGTAVGRDDVARWAGVYREVAAVRLPIIDLALAWLEACSDWVSGRIALVHRDLRIGNVVVDDGRVAAVLDWETAEFTDPAADVARFNLPTFRGRSPLASLLIEFDDFLGEYARLTDWRPSEQALRYWTVLELLNIIIGSMRASRLFAEGATSDVRYATMSYQIHHHIRWLVALYEAGAWGSLR